MSGLWGYQTALDLFLQENGITTLLFSGVNSDQVFFVLKKKKKNSVSISYKIFISNSASWVLL